MGSSEDRELMSAADVSRTISRIAHQIIEKTALDGPDAPQVILLGIPTRGVTLAARHLGQNVAVWGAHAAANPSWPEAFRQGRVVPVAEGPSLADALGGGASAKLFPFLRKELAGLVALSEEALEDAVAWTHRTHHQIIEGGAAVAVGALLGGTLDLRGRRVGVVLSGGNIDEDRLLPLLGRGGRRTS